MLLHRKKKPSVKNVKSVFSLLTCWRRHRFYFAQHDVLDDVSAPDSEKGQNQEHDHRPAQLKHPSEAYFEAQKSPLPTAYKLRKSTTKDSFQDSIESMDSLVESYWDPGDDTSQSTAIVSNTVQNNRRSDFLNEHLNFLSLQTQPREVEQVYNT